MPNLSHTGSKQSDKFSENGKHTFAATVDARKASQIPPNATDWPLLELRDANSNLVAAKSAFVNRSGQIVRDTGRSGIIIETKAGSYYLIFKHRNHLAIMSRQPVWFTNYLVTCDFTTNSSQYYGGTNACVELEQGVWGMIAGDADGDGRITAADRAIVSNQMGKTGYLSGDVNLDGKVNSSDQ